MAIDHVELAKFLIAELRKEILEAQKIRAQIIGFKIMFVSAGAGLIVANLQSVPIEILVVPALAAVFFDLLITSYSISIKRIGFYCRCYLEPMLKKEVEGTESTLLWEEFLSKQRSSMIEDLGMIGNLGITSLSVGAAAFVLIYSLPSIKSVLLLAIMTLFTLYDFITFFHRGTLQK